MSASGSGLYMRPVRPSDSPALSRICLLTGDAGKSAESIFSIGELLGLFYACPYVSLPRAGGFVLARRVTDDLLPAEQAEDKDSEEDVLGYVLFSYNTRMFEDTMEREWFPPLCEKYPKPLSKSSETGDPWGHYNGQQLTERDKQYISNLHDPPRSPDACVAFSPAHLHIDILTEAQRQGWGRRLIDSAVRYLRDERGLSGLWLGLDPKNVDARRFYERIGFKPIGGAPDYYMGLKFDEWTFT